MSTASRLPCDPTDSDDDLDPHIPADELPPEDVFTRAFVAMKRLADTVSEDRLRAMNVHAELAYVNAKTGFAIFEPHFPTVRAIPGVDAEAIERVPLTALALLGASHRLNLLAPPESQLPAKLLEGRKTRKVLLHFAQAGAGLGLIPDPLVKRIVKGTGSLDAARDLIELALLLREYEPALAGQFSIDPKLLAKAADLGTWLRDALQPKNAPAKPKASAQEIRQATLDRARIWTLLLEGYTELQRVAAFLRVDVPSLQSRKALKKKAKKEA